MLFFSAAAYGYAIATLPYAACYAMPAIAHIMFRLLSLLIYYAMLIFCRCCLRCHDITLRQLR